MANFEVVSRASGEKQTIGWQKPAESTTSAAVAQAFADAYAYEDADEGAYFVRTVEEHHEIYDVYFDQKGERLHRRLK